MVGRFPVKTKTDLKNTKKVGGVVGGKARKHRYSLASASDKLNTVLAT